LRPSPNEDDRFATGLKNEAKAPSAENARAQIMRIMWDRKSSETAIVGYWRYVPLVAVSLAAVAGFAFFVLAPSVIGFVFGYLAIYSVCFAILAIINYKLAKAMNAHFRREAALRPLLIGIARQRSAQFPSSKAKECVSRMQRVDAEASKRERPKNEMMSAMSALPIVGIVFGYAFLRSLIMAQAEHERNWSEMLALFNEVTANSGEQQLLEEDRKSRKANFMPYFIISLLCFPFLAYWYRDIDKRTELHLQQQWKSEDQTVKRIT